MEGEKATKAVQDLYRTRLSTQDQYSCFSFASTDKIRQP